MLSKCITSATSLPLLFICFLMHFFYQFLISFFLFSISFFSLFHYSNAAIFVNIIIQFANSKTLATQHFCTVQVNSHELDSMRFAFSVTIDHLLLVFALVQPRAKKNITSSFYLSSKIILIIP